MGISKMDTTVASFAFFSFVVLHSSFPSLSVGEIVQSEDTLLPLTPEEEYSLKPDEEWPEEVAHLFENDQEKKERKETKSKQEKKRIKRWTEWVSEKHEFREDSW